MCRQLQIACEGDLSHLGILDLDRNLDKDVRLFYNCYMLVWVSISNVRLRVIAKWTVAPEIGDLELCTYLV